MVSKLQPCSHRAVNGLRASSAWVCLSLLLAAAAGAQGLPQAKEILRLASDALPLASPYFTEAHARVTIVNHETGASREARYTVRHGVRGDDWQVFRYEGDVTDADGSRHSGEVWNTIFVDGRLFFVPVIDGKKPTATYTTRDLETWTAESMAKLEGGDGLLGYYAHEPLPVVERLRTVQPLTLTEEEVDSQNCYVIATGNSDHTVYTVWIAPESNYCVLRAVVERSGTAIPPIPTENTATIDRYVYRLHHVGLETIGGRTMPMTCTIEESWFSGAELVAEKITEHTRVHVDFEPRFGELKLFEAALPLGRPIVNMNRDERAR